MNNRNTEIAGKAQKLFAQACQFHAKRDLEGAEKAYRLVLSASPTHVDALVNLGVILKGSGRTTEAIQLYLRAIRVAPDRAQIHSNLGNAYLATGDVPHAIAALEKAIALAPSNVGLELNLSGALQQAGRRSDAIARAKAVVARVPDNAEALDLLGALLAHSGNEPAALPYFERAVALQPSVPQFLSNLGSALLSAGRAHEARKHLEAAVTLEPRRAVAWMALGDAQASLREFDDAVRKYRRSVEVAPESAEGWFKLGSFLELCGSADTADAMRKALELEPTHLAALCWILGYAEKCGDFGRAESLLPRLVEVLSTKVGQTQDWIALANCAYGTLFHPMEEELHSKITRRIDELLVARAVCGRCENVAQIRTAGARIRIGYLSPNFRDHPVGHVMRSLFQAHDRERFEIHGFSTAFRREHPDYTERIRAGFDHFHVLGWRSPHEAAQAIRAAGIDILIDLDGYMDCSSPPILALRPAPVQIFWLGHAGGLGLSCVDYLIADRVVIPPGEEERYREKIIRLPHVYHCADTPTISASVPPRAECALPETGFVFCAFNNPQKIKRATFECWMRILARVPQSTLWFSNPQSRPELAQNFRAAATNAGIDPTRVVFASRMPDKAVHLARHRHAGLFLDSLNCLSASTTALDALWAGTPLLTVRGDQFGSRIATTFLQVLGLDELVCATLGEYEERAVQIALNPQEAQRLAGAVQAARQKSLLFAVSDFARQLERAFERVWGTHLAGKSPEGFDLVETSG